MRDILYTKTQHRMESERKWEHQHIQPIYSKRLAGYLLLKGFMLEDYQKSHKDSERTIFFFYESEELLRAMSEYNRLKNYKGGIVNI